MKISPTFPTPQIFNLMHVCISSERCSAIHQPCSEPEGGDLSVHVPQQKYYNIKYNKIFILQNVVSRAKWAKSSYKLKIKIPLVTKHLRVVFADMGKKLLGKGDQGFHQTWCWQVWLHRTKEKGCMTEMILENCGKQTSCGCVNMSAVDERKKRHK